MSLPDYCQSCGSEIKVQNHMFENGDEVLLACCKSEGLYAVLDFDENLARPSDFEVTDRVSTKLNNGDRVDMEANVQEGRYAIGGDGPLELFGLDG